MLISALPKCSLLGLLEPFTELWPPSLSLQGICASSWKLPWVLEPRLLTPPRDDFCLEALRRPRAGGETLRFPAAAREVGRETDWP